MLEGVQVTWTHPAYCNWSIGCSDCQKLYLDSVHMSLNTRLQIWLVKVTPTRTISDHQGKQAGRPGHHCEHGLKVRGWNVKTIHEGKMKSSSLAYNLHESWDKRSLGRNPDRSWCHLHTSVKLFSLQPMTPWTFLAAYERAATQSMDPWTATKKALH